MKAMYEVHIAFILQMI